MFIHLITINKFKILSFENQHALRQLISATLHTLFLFQPMDHAPKKSSRLDPKETQQ
jgi:hypothetical protein